MIFTFCIISYITDEKYKIKVYQFIDFKLLRRQKVRLIVNVNLWLSHLETSMEKYVHHKLCM